MEIGGKAMATEKNKGTKWDGKSRVSTDLYRKRYDEIFKKTKQANAQSDNVELEEHEQYLKELKDKL